MSALNKDEWVVMDRYIPSLVAYSFARGIPIHRSLDLFVDDDKGNKKNNLMPKPDLVIWLDGDPEGVLKRVTKRERFDQPQFQERVRQGLEQCMHIDRCERWIKIEGCHLLNIDAVHEKIVDAIQQVFN